MQRSREAWVIDASVSTKWYLKDELLVAEADQLRQHLRTGETRAAAPHIARHEIADAICTAAWVGRTPADTAIDDINSYLVSGISLDDDPDWLIEAAAALSLEYRIRVYDATYLALAMALGVGFVTADRKLFNAISGRLPFVRWLGDLRL